MSRAIIIVVDRLGSGFLGPYGNTWVDTPAINRFASQSILWEHFLSDSPLLSSVYHSYWSGKHAFQVQAQPAVPTTCLPQQLTAADIPTVLISDDQEILDHPAADGFADSILVPTEAPDTTVDSIEETQMANVLAEALQWLEPVPADSSFLAWIHVRGMEGPWDAPQMLREWFHDEEDPELPTWTTPPEQQQTDAFDPDELLGITQAYAGQISGLDSCLGAFWQAVEELPAGQQTLCALTSPRGFPLGQHGRIGACDHPLFGELLQVPCMLRLPADALAAQRVHSLVQPHNFYGTLLNWFEQTDLLATERVTPNPLMPANPFQPNRLNWPASNHRAVAVGPTQRALRTPAWFLHQPTTNPPQLYVKPDDRWETNDVANRCPDIVEQMIAQLDLCQQLFEQTTNVTWPTLPKLLAEGLD